MLAGNDAVAAILVLDDGRYLMQLRDDKPDIWFPGHWGCFGGAVDAGESPEHALERELREEIEFAPRQAAYFTRFDFDMTTLGLKRYYRTYYVVRMSADELAHLCLHEGKEMRAFDGDELLASRGVTPYDAFALHLYHGRAAIGRNFGDTKD